MEVECEIAPPRHHFRIILFTVGRYWFDIWSDNSLDTYVRRCTKHKRKMSLRLAQIRNESGVVKALGGTREF